MKGRQITCMYMIFTNLNQADRKGNQIMIHNKQVQKVQYFKFLGIFIDEKLKWHEHLRIVNQRISRALYALNKAKHSLQTTQLRMLYHSIVYPHLTYGITLWGSAHETHKSKLILTQKKIIRIINGSKYDAHSEPIFKKLNILKLDDIYKLNVAKYCHNYFSSTLPSHLLTLFSIVPDLHEYATRHNTRHTLKIHRPRTVTTSQHILCNGPKIWNSLSNTLYINHNSQLVRPQVFSKRLKKLFLSGYRA